MARIISAHYENEDTYARNEMLYILQNNGINAVRKIDTSSVTEKGIFALYKDTANNRFTIMTGALTEQYKYIDRRGEWVSNTGSFAGTVYTQLFYVDKSDTLPVKKQVIKGEVRELIRGTY